MTPRIIVLLCLGLLFISLPATATTSPYFTEVYPNPVQYDDRGEYLQLQFPTPTNLSNWSITDGEHTVYLPPRTHTGSITITTNRTSLPPWVTQPIIATDVPLQLANPGETLTLYHNTKPIDTVTYTNAPEGKQYFNTTNGWVWRPPGESYHPITSTTNLTGTAFSLPDNTQYLYDYIQTSTDRIYIGAYTYASTELTHLLCNASARGVDVRLLADAGPVGGMTHRQKTTLDYLATCNTTITLIGGDFSRYSFHHPKYAIIDDTTIILTENWKPSGTGGQSSRGWGLILHNSTITTSLYRLFQTDSTGYDTQTWPETRTQRQFVPNEPLPGTYPTNFHPNTHNIPTAELLIAPDNAESAITTKLDNADRSILIQQVSISNAQQPFMNATLHAARRGVDVTILLSNAWYVRDHNTAFTHWLTTYADTHNLPLTIAVAPTQPAFEKIHTKGIIIDDTTVILGSINWNNHSVRQNREIAIVVNSPEIAAHYTTIFFADWRGTQWTIPTGFLLATLSSITGAGLLARRTVTIRPQENP